MSKLLSITAKSFELHQFVSLTIGTKGVSGVTNKGALVQYVPAADPRKLANFAYAKLATRGARIDYFGIKFINNLNFGHFDEVVNKPVEELSKFTGRKAIDLPFLSPAPEPIPYEDLPIQAVIIKAETVEEKPATKKAKRSKKAA